MKRYLAFIGDRYYPGPGLSDLIGDFDELNRAIEVARERQCVYYSWARVYDQEQEGYPKKPIWENKTQD